MTTKVDAGPGLGHVLELYVPTQCRCKKPLPAVLRAETLTGVKRRMSEWFGGGTVRVERVRGFWELGSGELADEDVDVVSGTMRGPRQPAGLRLGACPILTAPSATRTAV